MRTYFYEWQVEMNSPRTPSKSTTKPSSPISSLSPLSDVHYRPTLPGAPFSINFWFSSAKRKPILSLLFMNLSVHFWTHASCKTVNDECEQMGGILPLAEKAPLKRNLLRKYRNNQRWLGRTFSWIPSVASFAWLLLDEPVPPDWDPWDGFSKMDEKKVGRLLKFGPAHLAN